MTAILVRRLTQIGIGAALAGIMVLVTQWAYPAGHLVVHLGRPLYSRAVADETPFVTIDITLANVGAEPVRVDREHFLLADTDGHVYQSDPATHFLRAHFDMITIAPGSEVKGATVFKLAPGKRAAWMLFVTPTQQVVRFRLL